MIVGIGLDVLETERMARALERHGERFEARVFTAAERSDCAERFDKVLAFAARFAAKEACVKALGIGWGASFSLADVEVLRLESGAPQLKVHRNVAARARELGVRNFHVSLTHQPGLAAAVVVLEG
jgi:holo-[acyl-carrier protein] synthase